MADSIVGWSNSCGTENRSRCKFASRLLWRVVASSVEEVQPLLYISFGIRIYHFPILHRLPLNNAVSDILYTASQSRATSVHDLLNERLQNSSGK